jgi:hypothetical protein
MRFEELEGTIQEIVDECDHKQGRPNSVLTEWRAKLEKEPTLLQPFQIDKIMRAVRGKLETNRSERKPTAMENSHQMLTEHDVLTQWRQLFQDHEINDTTMAQAEELLENLRLESPLRNRLAKELDDIQKLDQKK